MTDFQKAILEGLPTSQARVLEDVWCTYLNGTYTAALATVACKEAGLNYAVWLEFVEAGKGIEPDKGPDTPEDSKEPTLVLNPFSQVVRKPVKWLWHNWIPRGMLTCLEGPPGVGKSTMTIDIIARGSRGDALPYEDNAPNGVFNSLILGAEDPADSVIVNRLHVAGANLANVSYSDQIAAAGKRARFDLSHPNMDTLEKAIMQGGISLVYFDSVMGLLAGRNGDKQEHTRDVLEHLQSIAERTDCAMVIGRHFAKGASLRAAHERGAGSLAWTAVPRAVIQVGRSIDYPGLRIACVAKYNLVEPQPGRPFELRPVGVEFADKVQEFTKVDWSSEIEGFDPASLEQAPPTNDGRKQPKKEDEAKDFILAEIDAAGGCILVDELKRRWKQTGAGETAFNTARGYLKREKIIEYLKGQDGKSWVKRTDSEFDSESPSYHYREEDAKPSLRAFR